MSDIIFEYTPRNIYSHQGGGPSGLEGYNIWIKDLDSIMYFIGFFEAEDLEKNMKFYQDQGDTVYIRKATN
jgi:hypothetical protein